MKKEQQMIERVKIELKMNERMLNQALKEQEQMKKMYEDLTKMMMMKGNQIADLKASIENSQRLIEELTEE